MPEDKKTAALNPSAPTDGGQLSYLIFMFSARTLVWITRFTIRCP